MEGCNQKTTLDKSHPAIAAQAVGWDPSTVTYGSSKKVWWHCPLGHEWSASVASRTVMKSGCPVCANKVIVVGFNDLAHTHPDIAAQAANWDPSNVLAGTHKKLLWRCAKGHEWSATVHNRTGSNRSGCPYCSGNRVLSGFNDLAHVFPLVATEADGWDPSMVHARSNKKLPWKCPRGHRWSTSPNSRTGKGETGCPTCANQKSAR